MKFIEEKSYDSVVIIIVIFIEFDLVDLVFFNWNTSLLNTVSNYHCTVYKIQVLWIFFIHLLAEDLQDIYYN